MQDRFSFARLLAMMLKELIQLKRDRLTFAMIIAIPIIQMTLFGFAINGDPRRLPTAVVAQEQGPFTRSLVRALENTGYFEVVAPAADAAADERLIERGEVQFVFTVPAGFERALLRGEQPAL
ncbi:MAG TPA: ABC transporter permease, partial [Albitalea sp.]|nr:ABC transporter permease [Albitalea sp.]